MTSEPQTENIVYIINHRIYTQSNQTKAKPNSLCMTSYTDDDIWTTHQASLINESLDYTNMYKALQTQPGDSSQAEESMTSKTS